MERVWESRETSLTERDDKETKRPVRGRGGGGGASSPLDALYLFI